MTSADDTIAGAANDGTELLPPVEVPTVEAWSDDDDDDEDPEPTLWDAVADVAWPLFWMALAGFVIILACWILTEVDAAAHRGSLPAPSSAPSPSVVPASALPRVVQTPPDPDVVPPVKTTVPAVVPPTVTPTPDPAHPRPLQYDARGVPVLPKDATSEEQQQVLAAIFDRDGIPYTSPVAAAIDADSVCSYLDSAHRTFADLILWVGRTHPSLTAEQRGGFVGASTGVYCRQYGYLLDPNNASATS